MRLLSLRDIRTIHRRAIEIGGITGESPGRPLEAVIARVENAAAYGQIADPIDLAAWTAYAIAQGHPFNDANKRTAWLTLRACLAVNGMELDTDVDTAVAWMVGIAKGAIEVEEFSKRLRNEMNRR